MGTNITPEISKSSEYYISRHRYYELKHFCLQYPEWKKAYSQGKARTQAERTSKGSHSDPTYSETAEHLVYRKRMDAVETAASLADPSISEYILIAVTEGLSYPQIKARLDVPCGKDYWYDRYRRFFAVLDHILTQRERRLV